MIRVVIVVENRRIRDVHTEDDLDLEIIDIDSLKADGMTGNGIDDYIATTIKALEQIA